MYRKSSTRQHSTAHLILYHNKNTKIKYNRYIYIKFRDLCAPVLVIRTGAALSTGADLSTMNYRYKIYI